MSSTQFAASAKREPAKYRMDPTDTISIGSVVLTRIIANTDIEGVVAKGEKGGYIQCFWNLSQNGTCWVHDGAFVIGEEAQVMNDAQIKKGGSVYGCVISADAVVDKPVTESQPNLEQTLAYMARKESAAKAARLTV
ncbi:MAG: hypothetical protein KGQ41_06090 [Alphaproteobacteria bacterium]|nr:hypothetical protein [Alphaproteobacteria bacterium]